MNKKSLIFLAIVLSGIIVYALSFSDITQGDFNDGAYVNTSHNGTAVVLSGTNLTGTYTSSIFDATSIARWDNLSAYNITPSRINLFVGDVAADVWKSNDGGIIWNLIKDDYNNGVANGGVDLEKNSTHLFLLHNQDLWISGNFGVTWTKVNDDYNGAEGQNGDVLGIDSSNRIFIIEGDQDVWDSSDGGVTFTKAISNFNGGNGVVVGLTINSSGALYAVDVAADVWVSIDQGVSWSLVKDDFNGAIGNSADDLIANSSNALFILDRQDFWSSVDNGVTWTLVNTDINGGGDANDGLVAYADQENILYVLDGSEDVLRSTDEGVTFTKVNGTDFNGGNGNVFGMNSLVMTSSLSFQVRNCSSSDCSDGAFQTADLNGMNLQGRYFQYRINFTSQEVGITPFLYNTSIGYTILDNTPPQFSSLVENPSNNSAYLYGQSYKFNSTITDNTAIGSFFIDFNGTNMTTGIVSSGSVYTFTKNDLAVGTYYYKWWANDSYGNINSSGTTSYVVGMGNSSTNMNITGTTPIMYGNLSDFTGVETNNGDGGCVYSLNNSNAVFGVGTMTFNYSTSGCSNYTSGSYIKQLTVNKTTPFMSISGTTPINHGTATDIVASEGNSGDADVSYLLYRNGTLLGGTSDTSFLAAGSYTYLYTTSGGQNYSSKGTIFDLIINGHNANVSLTFDKVSPQSFGTSLNVSCLADSQEASAKLYRNNQEVTLLENNQNIFLAVGIYNYTCNVSASQNYSYASASSNFTIQKIAGDIRLYFNGLENNFTLWSIQQSNITATTLYGTLNIYMNGTNITSENGLNETRGVGFYNVTAVSSGDENHSEASVTRWLNITLDGAAPSLSLIAPSEGDIYGYNTNLSLDYSVSDDNLQSCWYNIDGGTNAAISNCLDTTFNVTGTGNYSLSLYANDSYGNENSIVANFSVQLDAPTITLSSPKNVYLNYSNVTFRYTPGDVDLETCELWGNFTGTFVLDQTNSNPLNYTEDTFNHVLSDGTYLWNVRCTDSNGHSAFDGNKIFSVDTTSPSILISNPLGSKDSRTVSASWSVSDASPVSCVYNVYRGVNVEISNTSVSCSSGSALFSVTVDADFTFNFYTNDSAGNLNSANSNFSVSTLIPSSSSGGGGGGSGSSSGAKKSVISTGNISNLVVSEGGIKKILTWKVKNAGNAFLNECKFKGSGNYASWIPYTETKGLAAGEEYEFVFDVNIPEEVYGKYLLGVSLTCKEASASATFNVEISGKQVAIELTNVERATNDKVKIDYTLEELTGKDQQIDLQFLLFDADNKQIAEVSETKFISAEVKDEYEVFIPISETLEGEIRLLVNLNSDTYSTFVQENLVLGAPISGLAIFSNRAFRDNMISGLIVVLFLTFSFFIVRRIRTHKSVHHAIIKTRRMSTLNQIKTAHTPNNSP